MLAYQVGQPANAGAENFLGQLLGILGGGNGDDRVGVDVVHVFAGDIGVQGRVDAGRPGVVVEDAAA